MSRSNRRVLQWGILLSALWFAHILNVPCCLKITSLFVSRHSFRKLWSKHGFCQEFWEVQKWCCLRQQSTFLSISELAVQTSSGKEMYLMDFEYKSIVLWQEIEVNKVLEECLLPKLFANPPPYLYPLIKKKMNIFEHKWNLQWYFLH